MSTLEFGYVAGIIDGEGTLICAKKRGVPAYPRVAVRMTDRDVLERLQGFFGGTIVDEVSRASSLGKKSLFLWHVSDSKKAAGIMMMIYPLLSNRRQDKVRQILTDWRSYVPALRGAYVRHRSWA